MPGLQKSSTALELDATQHHANRCHPEEHGVMKRQQYLFVDSPRSSACSEATRHTRRPALRSAAAS
jgi:hypothetical protein